MLPKRLKKKIYFKRENLDLKISDRHFPFHFSGVLSNIYKILNFENKSRTSDLHQKQKLYKKEKKTIRKNINSQYVKLEKYLAITAYILFES